MDTGRDGRGAPDRDRRELDGAFAVDGDHDDREVARHVLHVAEPQLTVGTAEQRSQRIEVEQHLGTRQGAILGWAN